MIPTRTVLVVDDDPSVRELIASALRRKGYEVLTAADGHAAERVLHARRPDLVVTDMLMPGPSGFQVAAMVKDMTDGRVPVVMVSGTDATAHQDFALAAGIDEFVAKPFAVADLLAVVADLCPPAPAGSRGLSRAALTRA